LKILSVENWKQEQTNAPRSWKDVDGKDIFLSVLLVPMLIAGAAFLTNTACLKENEEFEDV
jgi:hypothetical protein